MNTNVSPNRALASSTSLAAFVVAIPFALPGCKSDAPRPAGAGEAAAKSTDNLTGKAPDPGAAPAQPGLVAPAPSPSPKAKAAGYELQWNVPLPTSDAGVQTAVTLTLDEEAVKASDTEQRWPIGNVAGGYVNCQANEESQGRARELCGLARIDGARLVVPVAAGGSYGVYYYRGGNQAHWFEPESEGEQPSRYDSVERWIAYKKEDGFTVTTERTVPGSFKAAVIFKEVFEDKISYRPYFRATFGQTDLVCGGDLAAETLADAEKTLADCLMLQGT